MVEFKSEKVTDRITRIKAPKTELMYLIEGDKRAALIDTGCGFGSLKNYISSLTDKELIVLITHGHLDHALGSKEFEEVYMNHKDEYIYTEHCKKEKRIEELEGFPVIPDFEESDFIEPAPLEHYKDLSEGDRFDLGGITIETYDCPGHTIGSEVFLIKEERILITGDACNGLCFMFEDYSTSIEEYRESLIRLLPKVKGKYDRVLSSHVTGELDVSVIEESIEVCDDLIKGNGGNDTFQFKGLTGYIAEPVNKDNFSRLDGKCANIVYDKNNIMKKA